LGLKELLKDIVEVRKNIKSIMPTTTEFSKRFLLENKMKTVSDVVSSELSIRKQIDSSIKTEFDLANKTTGDSDITDMRALAGAIEKYEKEKKDKK